MRQASLTNSVVGPQQPSQFAQNMARSMTIDEMRHLHQRALRDAEAKRTELKLVLASRYRELVGSSDEVIKMKERAQELHDLVQALPSLMTKLAKRSTSKEDDEKEAADKAVETGDEALQCLRRKLSEIPRVIHHSLDQSDVHSATVKLIELFTLIASQTDIYPIANMLSELPSSGLVKSIDPDLETQVRMIFLQMQSLPEKISRVASRSLASASSYGKHTASPIYGAHRSAAALASLHFFKSGSKEDKPEALLTIYFDSKAKLLVSLLEKLKSPSNDDGAGTAERILSKIVLILQYDVIMHPYQIFVLRNFPVEKGNAERIMKTLPIFNRQLIKAKCSKFLATHLPLIRNKVKSVLVSIAGTTASALGQIRQSLYDKTDGIESIEKLNDNDICTWDEAVGAMIDIHIAFNNVGDGANDTTTQKFSLWAVLFSSTFSSLVHSLLTSAFQSVHTSVISSLRTSLSNAPPLSAMLPHEAYRNTLTIATNLDKALLKVSEDAHELLVHAEERIESERRLRQSLYVHTCEIMGRLICELRRLAFIQNYEESDATKEFIIGRLCYLLKFRLSSLPTLLSPESSPASIRSTIGMIYFVDLQSAFDLADHDEDGLITFEEAMEAVESAFAGTPFHGAEMVKETLLMSTSSKEARGGVPYLKGKTPSTVTLGELSLLTARGLRHEKSGRESALGTVQHALDGIVAGCFQQWASTALSSSSNSFSCSLNDFLITANSVNDEEWCRMFHTIDVSPGNLTEVNLKGVSPYIIGFFLNCSSILNRSFCPSDSLSPVPTNKYALSLGISLTKNTTPASLADTMRRSLTCGLLKNVISVLHENLCKVSESRTNLENACRSAIVQLYTDISFLHWCVAKVKNDDLGIQSFETTIAESEELLNKVASQVEEVMQKFGLKTSDLSDFTSEMRQHALEFSSLFFSSLFDGERNSPFSFGVELIGNVVGSIPAFHVPISSSRRFVLLPVQADRSLNDIQLHGMYTKEKEQAANRHESTTEKVMSSGFGFFSSMLKKK